MICHYTNLNSLFGILESGKIFASSVLNTNDKSELVHFKTVISSSVREIITQIININNLDRSMLDQYYDEIERIIFKQYPIQSTFIFCASKYDNDDGLLAMWRGYGRANDSVGIVMRSNFSSFLMSSNVHYCNELGQQEEQSLLGNRYISNSFQSIIMQGRLDSEISKTLQELMYFVIFYKHPSFKDEQEYRVSFFAEENEIKIRLKNGQPVSYIERCVPISNIIKLIVGPSDQQDKILINLQLYEPVKANNIEVVKSTIPFVWD